MDFRVDSRVARWKCHPKFTETRSVGGREPNTASHKMLLSDLATLRAASIVLASGSPRRVDMFNALLKLNARVVP